MSRDFESTIHTELEGKLDYGTYLGLDKILSAQNPLAQPAYHDEMVFIVQHQTSELWMKLILHELAEALQNLKADQLSPCFKVLARVKQIQRMLFEQWAVLETLTPSEFARFRSVLGNASGLQSYQFRMVEFALGNKDKKAAEVFRHRPDVYRELQSLLAAPSLYDEFLFYLSRSGFDVPASSLKRDWTSGYIPNDELVPTLLKIYQEPERHWQAYEMAEKLIDVDLHMALWRYRHLRLVERIIGFKGGTGGSSGAKFLREGADVKLFPELWQVRTAIGS